MGLLKFALLGIDLLLNLGWPAIALFYPLFASIWAVETDSRYHMRKMVIYWTLFSSFSLFECGFVKIIEGIPFWCGIRLAVGLLLVMPQFEGAGLAYQGLVRSFIHGFGILNEERLRKSKASLNAVEKYIEENGSEALEKLIVSQMTPPEARVQNRHPETPLLNKSEITGVGESKLNVHLRGSKHKPKLVNDTRPLPLGTHAAAEFKGRMPPKEPESSHLNKAWQEWYCDLCKVNTASKSMFNAHLQGSKHNSNLESLKASSLDAKDTGSLDAKDTGPFSHLVQHMEPVSEDEEIMPPKETAERLLETPLKKAHPEWTGDVCKVTTENESVSNDHIQGNQHKSTLETTLKASSLEAKDTGPSSLKVQHMQPVSAFEEEEIMPPKESAEKGLPETPILEKAQREWTSDRYSATNENELMLFDHLHGSNQKSKLEKTLEASLSFAKDTGPSPLSLCLFKVKNAERKWTCDLCNVTTSSEITLNSHLQGRKHMDKFVTTMKQNLFELEKLTVSKVEYEQSIKVPGRTGDNPEAKETLPSREASCEETPPPKKEWSCGFCKVKGPSEKHLNAHLLGRKHKSKLELLTTRKGKLVVLQFDGKFKYWCILCAAKLPNDLSLASHVGGKRHATNIDELDDKVDI